MKSIRRLHLYLGCFFAPLLVVFALTGALQTYELHESTKDGTYAAPRWIKVAANLHKHSVLAKGSSPTAMRVLIAAMSLALVLTMVLGVVLAFKLERSAWPVAGCLVLGVIVPIILLALAAPPAPP